MANMFGNISAKVTNELPTTSEKGKISEKIAGPGGFEPPTKGLRGSDFRPEELLILLGTLPISFHFCFSLPFSRTYLAS